MADYGSDITFTGLDITPQLIMTTDSSVVIEAIALRLQSDPGSLWYDHTYGYNVNSLFKNPMIMENNSSKIQSRIVTECKKDPRVRNAVVTVSEFDYKNKSCVISVGIELTDGTIPETLVFSING